MPRMAVSLLVRIVVVVRRVLS